MYMMLLVQYGGKLETGRYRFVPEGERRARSAARNVCISQCVDRHTTHA